MCACFHHLELEPLIWIKHYGNGRPVPAILLVRPLDLDISLHIWWPGGLSLCRQGFFLLSNRRNALMTLALHLLPLGCPVPEFLILRKIREHFRNLMFHPPKKQGWIHLLFLWSASTALRLFWTRPAPWKCCLSGKRSQLQRWSVVEHVLPWICLYCAKHFLTCIYNYVTICNICVTICNYYVCLCVVINLDLSESGSPAVASLSVVMVRW